MDEHIIASCPHCHRVARHTITDRVDFVAQVKAYLHCNKCLRSWAKWFGYFELKDTINYTEALYDKAPRVHGP